MRRADAAMMNRNPAARQNVIIGCPVEQPRTRRQRPLQVSLLFGREIGFQPMRHQRDHARARHRLRRPTVEAQIAGEARAQC